jgi:Protein of unknown function (DUF3800)
MLQAFVDDSISAKPPVFILGGYVAPAERWAEFSDEWQAVLEIPPRLEYFKMQEAWPCKGQFDGWSVKRRNERLGQLYAVIEKHVSAEILIGFRPDAFKTAHAGWQKKARNPYYFAVANLMVDLALGRQKLRLEGPIDFIFDTQIREAPNVLAAWEFGWRVSLPDPPNLREILPNPPIFRDEKKVLPLQAADLFAWWVRRNFVEQINGQEPIRAPINFTRSIPRMDLQYNEQQLRRAVIDKAALRGSYKSTSEPRNRR